MKQLILILMFGGFSSCATILQNGPDHIPVRSEPEGAKVFLNGMPVGTTPMVVDVRHSDDCSIEVRKEGYDPAVISRGKVLSGWLLGNIILGGGVGAIVDLATYNQGHYPGDPIYVDLAKKEGPKPASTHPTEGGL